MVHGLYTDARLSSIGVGKFIASVSGKRSCSFHAIQPTNPLHVFLQLTMFFSILTIALPTSIIGSNFMAEYQIYQRQRLQRRVNKNREKHLHLNISSAMRKSEQIKSLNEQNQIMLQAIGEIQERLSDVEWAWRSVCIFLLVITQ